MTTRLEKTSILRHKEVKILHNDIAWLYVAHYYEFNFN